MKYNIIMLFMKSRKRDHHQQVDKEEKYEHGLFKLTAGLAIPIQSPNSENPKKVWGN
jgi:hypothetical protein